MRTKKMLLSDTDDVQYVSVLYKYCSSIECKKKWREKEKTPR